MLRVYGAIVLVVALLVSGMPLTIESASAHAFGSAEFERTWARTDQPVAAGQVNRTWMWGPSGHSTAFHELYADAPEGTRLVQYTDKSRMEDNSFRASPPWDVTNGRLAWELITGEMQKGDALFEYQGSSDSQVAGDSHPDSPTYATFSSVLNREATPVGTTIVETIDKAGNIGSNGGLAQYGVTAQTYVPETDHTIASVFWSFMNSSGIVYENGQYQNAQLFENPFFATGYPITGAYWMHVPVGGQWSDVLGQCFERRCLTYNPANSAGWQVEAGNIGQHYHQWRHGGSPSAPAPPPPPSGPSPDEIAYALAVLELFQYADLSFDLFFSLIDNPTLDAQWYSEFDQVILAWWSLHPALDALDPPPSFVPFHNKLLEAFDTLSSAADAMLLGVTLPSEFWLTEGFNLINQFLTLYNEALTLVPSIPGIGDYLSTDSTAALTELSDSEQNTGGSLLIERLQEAEGSLTGDH
jgi:hypothetical protein